MTRSTVGTSADKRIRSESSIGRSRKGKTDMIGTSKLRREGGVEQWTNQGIQPKYLYPTVLFGPPNGLQFVV